MLRERSARGETDEEEFERRFDRRLATEPDELGRVHEHERDRDRAFER